MSDAGRFRFVVAHEVRLLWADRSLWVVCGLLACLLAFALHNGFTEVAEREAVLARIAAEEPERDKALVDQWHRVMTSKEKPDPWRNPVDPWSVGGGMGARTAILPYLGLAPLALGQSDMQPNYYRVTFRAKASFMDDSELESPWHLLTGAFDPLFVIVYLLPLAVLALSWNLLSAEREQGTLRLLLSQPLTVVGLVAGKVTVRALAVCGTMLLVLCATLLAQRPELRGAPGSLAATCGIVLAYATFWFALAAAVNALGRSSAFNALVLVSCWVVLVLLVPVLLNLFVSQASPAPSRIEFATHRRLAAIEALNRYAKQMGTDYGHVEKPDILLPKNGRFVVAPRLQGYYLIYRDSDKQVEALHERFNEQLAGQQALVARWSWLSPAIVANEALTALAGTSSQRYLEFREQVAAYHVRWKAFFEPKFLQGLAVTEADLRSRPRFAWQEPPAAELRAALRRGAMQLLVPALLLAALTAWALRRFRAV